MLRTDAARSGPLDRARLDAAVAVDVQEALGRRARDDELAEIEVGGEGRGIAQPQPAVQLERRPCKRRLESLREIRLKDVAGVDVLDDPRNRVEVAGTSEVRAQPGHVGDGVGGSGVTVRTPGVSLRDKAAQSFGEAPGALVAGPPTREPLLHERQSARRPPVARRPLLRDAR